MPDAVLTLYRRVGFYTDMEFCSRPGTAIEMMSARGRRIKANVVSAILTLIRYDQPIAHRHHHSEPLNRDILVYIWCNFARCLSANFSPILQVSRVIHQSQTTCSLKQSLCSFNTPHGQTLEDPLIGWLRRVTTSCHAIIPLAALWAWFDGGGSIIFTISWSFTMCIPRLLNGQFFLPHSVTLPTFGQ